MRRDHLVEQAEADALAFQFRAQGTVAVGDGVGPVERVDPAQEFVDYGADACCV